MNAMGPLGAAPLPAPDSLCWPSKAPTQMIDPDFIRECLKTKTDGRLYHRENQELEFKEQFNVAGLDQYLRDFAAFGNNRGGYLIFGIKDKPRLPNGMNAKSTEQFEKLDPEKLTGFLLEIFDPEIEYELGSFEVRKKVFGVMRVYEAKRKPIVAKKDEGKQQSIKNGEIYYRYGGRTQKIQFAELTAIIEGRIAQTNTSWMDLIEKIGKAGPANAAILDTEEAVISKSDRQILVVDDSLAKKLKFIKEGQFSETEGHPTLQLVGDVVPVSQVDVVKRIRENLHKDYPFSAMELVDQVKAVVPDAKQSQIWKAIADNDLKFNRQYSTYVFRNKKQEDDYKLTGAVPKVTPSIYNRSAIDFVAKVIGDDIEDGQQTDAADGLTAANDL